MKTNLSKIIGALIFSVTLCGAGFFAQSLAAEKTGGNAPESKKVTVDDSSYIIGPMDVLTIQVWREPDFSHQVLVRPDGKITFPLIDDVQAAGMTTLALKTLLTEKLESFVDNPEVTVIVLESHSKNFYIIGKVNGPGTYPLLPGMTVLQALSVAGGLQQMAHKDRIRIIRRSGGKEEVFRFDYSRVIAGRNLKQNILLEPNDTIIVP
jgi:polysaccharide export outer membrane protein